MKCEHPNKQIVEMPKGHIHHAKSVCLDCGAFITWLPKPETIERRIQNEKNIKYLMEFGNKTAWEKEFIESLSKQGPKISPKQQEILDKMIKNYG